MNIGIIGAGHIGGALASGWVNAGHKITFGVRDPANAEMQRQLIELGLHVQAGTMQDAARFGEVIAFAIPGSAMQDTLTQIGDLHGKILIDCTNGLGTPAKSGAQMVAEWAKGAQVFKAFNSIGYENLTEPRFGTIQADMFYCGDDSAARQVVAQLIADIGFNPMYVGDLTNAGSIEMLAGLWGSLAYKQHLGRRLAFKMLIANDKSQEKTGR